MAGEEPFGLHLATRNRRHFSRSAQLAARLTAATFMSLGWAGREAEGARQSSRLITTRSEQMSRH
jgi:hypothetical protein